MTPLDPSTLDSDTPRTLDGRSYPDELRQYERYDAVLLPLAIDLSRFELVGLQAEARLEHGYDAVLVSRWLTSAEWRGLIERRDGSMADTREYGATERTRQQLQRLGGDA